MVKKFIPIILSILLFSALSMAQEQTSINVDALSFCTAINERQPQDIASTFPPDVGRIYCFTKLSGADAPTTISHIWYFNDKEMARLDLKVNAKNWRTWSSKKIISQWTGSWRVDILSQNGQLLDSKEFTVGND